MKRLVVIAALAAVLGSAAASAQGLRIQRTCLDGRAYCVTTYMPTDAPGLGKTIDVPMDPEEDVAGRAARITKWQNFCQPKIVVDSLGVSRYAYAHKDCDIGRSE